MNRPIASVILVLIPSLSAKAQSTIGGRVTDSVGAVVANARVLIHCDPSGRTCGAAPNLNQDMSVVTDSTGMYSITVPTGFYDVFVSAPAFTPIAAKVIVKEHRQTKLNLKLFVDPLVSKVIGAMEVQGVPPKP
jgi:hypothetical protein